MRVPIAIVFWLVSSSALAQVNAETLRSNPLRGGWAGGIDASFALSRGNIELFDLGGAGRIQWQSLHPLPPPIVRDGEVAPPSSLPFIAQRVFLTANGRFAERAGTPFISQAFVHARWTAMWHERFGTDVFAQAQSNDFQRLQLRVVTGLGPRFEIVHEPVFMMWGGSAYMFEYDRISVQPGTLDAPETLEHRWSNYLTMRLAVLDNQLLFQNTVYYQPRFDAFEDFRLLEELEVSSRVGTMFLLGATLSVLYDSMPPTGVAPADLRLVTTLRLDV